MSEDCIYDSLFTTLFIIVTSSGQNSFAFHMLEPQEGFSGDPPRVR